MRRKIKAIWRLGRRRGRHILENILGGECLSCGYISPEMHKNLHRLSELRKDLRL
jgi:hypothetical protein